MTQTNDDVIIEDDKDKNLTPEEIALAADEDKTKQDAEAAKADANLDSEQVDYKNKFSESAKEAIKLTKENANLTSKATLQDKMIEVAKDPDQIHEIAKHNPKIANAICKNYGWGDTYSEAVSSDDDDDDDDNKTVIDPRVAAAQVYDQRDADKEAKKVSDYEVQFFIDNKISIGSAKYKAIMSTYSKYQPKNLQDSQEMFQFAHSKHVPDEEVEIPAPNGDFSGTGKTKTSEFTDEDKEIMKEKGWDEKKMKAFKASNLY